MTSSITYYAIEAELSDLKTQNEILRSQLKQKDEEIALLHQSLAAYKKTNKNVIDLTNNRKEIDQKYKKEESDNIFCRNEGKSKKSNESGLFSKKISVRKGNKKKNDIISPAIAHAYSNFFGKSEGTRDINSDMEEEEDIDREEDEEEEEEEEQDEETEEDEEEEEEDDDDDEESDDDYSQSESGNVQQCKHSKNKKRDMEDYIGDNSKKKKAKSLVQSKGRAVNQTSAKLYKGPVPRQLQLNLTSFAKLPATERSTRNSGGIGRLPNTAFETNEESFDDTVEKRKAGRPSKTTTNKQTRMKKKGEEKTSRTVSRSPKIVKKNNQNSITLSARMKTNLKNWIFERYDYVPHSKGKHWVSQKEMMECVEEFFTMHDPGSKVKKVILSDKSALEYLLASVDNRIQLRLFYHHRKYVLVRKGSLPASSEPKGRYVEQLSKWLLERYDYHPRARLSQNDLYESVEEFFDIKSPNRWWKRCFSEKVHKLKKYCTLQKCLSKCNRLFQLQDGHYPLKPKRNTQVSQTLPPHSLLRKGQTLLNPLNEYEDESETDEDSVEIAFEDENAESPRNVIHGKTISNESEKMDMVQSSRLQKVSPSETMITDGPLQGDDHRKVLKQDKRVGDIQQIGNRDRLSSNNKTGDVAKQINKAKEASKGGETSVTNTEVISSKEKERPREIGREIQTSTENNIQGLARNITQSNIIPGHQ